MSNSVWANWYAKKRWQEMEKQETQTTQKETKDAEGQDEDR